MNKTSKVLSVFMIVLMLFSIMFSLVFISSNIHHDCTGEDCPICEMVELAETTITRLMVAAVVAVFAMVLCVLAQDFFLVSDDSIRYNTPILLKVKLQD